jgi:hypothetical protein
MITAMTHRLVFLFCLICCSAVAVPLTTTNLLLNPGGEAGSLTNWVAGGDSNPRLDNGAFDHGINPRSGTNDFLAGTGAIGSLSQMVPLVGNQGITSVAIDSGNLLAYLSFWEQGLNQGTPSDDVFVSLGFLDAVSNSISVWNSPEIDSHLGAWSNFSAYASIPVNTRFIQYTMNFVRHVGSDLDGFVDDNILSVSVAVQVPRLSISGSSTNAVLSWLTTYSDGFVLIQNTNLATTNWTVLGNPVTTLNGTNQVSVSPLLKGQFFRLYHP